MSKQDPAGLATQLSQAHEALSQGQAQEHSARSLSVAKEQRDRYYTLCLEPLRELRAFANFAFRGDKGNNRRFAFTSAYTRRANRRYQRKLREQDNNGTALAPME